MKPRIEVARSDEQVVPRFMRMRAHPVWRRSLPAMSMIGPRTRKITILDKCTFVRRRLRWEPNAGAKCDLSF